MLESDLAKLKELAEKRRVNRGMAKILLGLGVMAVIFGFQLRMSPPGSTFSEWLVFLGVLMLFGVLFLPTFLVMWKSDDYPAPMINVLVLNLVVIVLVFNWRSLIFLWILLILGIESTELSFYSHEERRINSIISKLKGAILKELHEDLGTPGFSLDLSVDSNDLHVNVRRLDARTSRYTRNTEFNIELSEVSFEKLVHHIRGILKERQ